MRLVMRLSALAVLALGITLGTPAGHTLASPTLDAHMWDKLAALPSYHVDSSLRVTGSITSSVSMRWTEDARGKDLHLVMAMHASTSGSQDAEIYLVKGRYFIGRGGHFIDSGAAGKQVTAQVLTLTLGYWTAFTDNPRNVQYVGHVTTNGRLAGRFKVRYAAIVPGVPSANAGASGGSVAYLNTVDVDVKTHVPLSINGTFHGTDNQHHTVDFSTSFSLTRISKVPPIKAPAALSVPGL